MQLAGPEPPAWSAMPPSGWEPVAWICHEVFQHLPNVVERINGAISAEIPEFAPGLTAFDERDLAITTTRNVAGFLHGIAENRGPDEQVLGFRRLVGQVSARRGFPLQPLLASYLLAYRVLWALLIERAEAAGSDASMMLLRAGDSIWRWMHETTTVIALAYNQELADRDATGVRVLAHLLEAIEQDGDPEIARSLAERLGFVAEGTFQAIALTGSASAADATREIIAGLQRTGAVTATTQRGGVSLVLLQGSTRDAISTAIATRRTGGIGVGTALAGLRGALTSVWEAEHALELAVRDDGIRWFEDAWLPSLALRHAHLASQLAPAARVAALKPHLAAAIRAFAASGFSIADGARSLHVSEGSFRYRLQRWETMTGLTPTSFDGLARSLLALELPDGRA